MAATNRQGDAESKARIRIDIEAGGEPGEEFAIRIYSGHSKTTNSDKALMVAVYKVMSSLMKHPSRTKTVTDENGNPKKVAPQTKSGKRFPTLFPFVTRRK